MSDEARRHFLLGAAYYAVLGALAWVFFRYLLGWLLPFLLAYAAAEATEPAVRFLQRRLRVKRGFAAAVVTLALLAALGALLSLILGALVREARGVRLTAVLDALEAILAAVRERLEVYCAHCPTRLRALVSEAMADWTRYARSIGEGIAARLAGMLAAFAAALPHYVLAAATTVLALFFFSASLPTLRAAARERLGAARTQRLRQWRGGAVRSMGQWLRAQALLCLMTFLQLLAALSLLGSRFALLGALLITLVDALPVFGVGTILVPWAAVELMLGSVERGAMLAATYLCTLTVRSIAEPKLLAKRAGVPPVASLAAMYLGFRAFGVGGMLLFPFLLLLAAGGRGEAGTRGDG